MNRRGSVGVIGFMMPRWGVIGLALCLSGCLGTPKVQGPVVTGTSQVYGAGRHGGFADFEVIPASAEPSRQRLRIQRGSIALQVERVPDAVLAIEAIARDLDAFIESQQSYKDESASLVLRVPADRLDQALARLAELGEETRRKIEARDVTDEVGDLEARRHNLIALRDRMRSLLQRAVSVEDVLRVEKELTRLQTELDALEGRLTRLKHDVARARLEVHLSTLQPPEPKRILGPLGYLYVGTKWFVEKLFVIRPGAP